VPAYIYAILAAGWLVWVAPFFLVKRGGGAPQTLDRRARWGIILECLAYSLLWQNSFWTRSPRPWQMASGVAFLVLAGVLSWTSARTLGRQWRLDAGLNADHQLIQSGAYRVVRHPIYTSMLCMLVGTGMLITPMLVLVLAIGIFMIGTEIRVRIEDAMLASRFGDQFRTYQRTVPAYVPFVR
jgi:protein-S-isoprenylcysteine O-methyltransferase Ste14